MNTAIDHVLQRQNTWLRGSANPSEPGFSTGFSKLDQALHASGWPQGNLVELLSDGAGLGCMGLLLPTMETLSKRGRWQVFIAPPCTPYAPLLDARGIDSQQILLVHPHNKQDLLWSVEQALRSGTCSAVFAWLHGAEFRYNELRKLQLAAANSDVFSVLLRPRQAAVHHSPATLRLEMKAYRQVSILKQPGGRQSINVNLGCEDDVPGQPQLWELPAYTAKQHGPH